MSPVGYAAGTGAGPVHTRFRGPDKMGPESRRARGKKHTDRFPLHVLFVFIRAPMGPKKGGGRALRRRPHFGRRRRVWQSLARAIGPP